MLGGGPRRNWSALSSVHGVTSFQDRNGLAPVRGSGCQNPSPTGGVYGKPTSDPSLARSATICAATSTPTAIPSSFLLPSGTCDSELASAASSAACSLGKRRTSTPWAAAAAAASWSALP